MQNSSALCEHVATEPRTRTPEGVCPLQICPYWAEPARASGNRLGMGGGYYDRTLASIQAQIIKPKLIGIAHDCQQVDQLPVQHWDIPVNAIVTPTQQLSFNRT